MKKGAKKENLPCERERIVFRKATLLQAYNISGRVRGMGIGERKRESNFFYYSTDVLSQDWLAQNTHFTSAPNPN